MLVQKLVEFGPEFGESWNFGPNEGDAISVLDVVEKLKRELVSSVSVEKNESSQPHEASVLRLDTSKARVKLGWRPALSIDETLAWTSEWALSHQSGQDMCAVTCRQIDRYRELVGNRSK